MHVTMVAVGSRGDVQPFVALGKRLQADNHLVRIATHDIHENMVRSHGLEFAPIAGNPKEMLKSLRGQAWLKSGRNPVAFWHGFRKLSEQAIQQSLSDAVEACRGTEAIILHLLWGARASHGRNYGHSPSDGAARAVHEDAGVRVAYRSLHPIEHALEDRTS